MGDLFPRPSEMIRRYARQRREYLYRKSLEGKEKELYERKQKLRRALAEGKAIPTELQLDDENTQRLRELVDDEYANAGTEEPVIFITTSRNPSSRLAQFAKEMRLVIPNAQRMNRGGHTIPEIINTCKSKGVSDVIVLHETRGQPD